MKEGANVFPFVSNYTKTGQKFDYKCARADGSKAKFPGCNYVPWTWL